MSQFSPWPLKIFRVSLEAKLELISDHHINARLVVAATFLQVPNHSRGKSAGLFFVSENSTLRKTSMQSA
jgi:hypothetical protein